MSPSRHEALPYAGTEQFGPLCRALVRDAQGADRPLMMLMADERLSAVRNALGGAAEEVTFVPTDVAGRNPVRISALLDSFQNASGGQPVVAVTDWGLPGRSPAALAETHLAESLLNRSALSSWPLELICLYDASALSPAVLAAMRRTHPHIRGEAGNSDFAADLADDLFAAELIDAPDELAVAAVGPTGLSAARAAVRAFAEDAGLRPERVDDLVLAANEIVTNSIRHGGGTARLALWQEGGAMLCQVTDTGRITDPLAGRSPAAPSAGSGRGLWLANQLCDLVQVRSSAAGTVVRLLIDHL